MRLRPFFSGGESPRPYSEIVAERVDVDIAGRILRDVADLEDRAEDARVDGDTDEHRRLQCEAEGLRCALHEMRRR